MRRLLPFLKPYRRQFILGPAAKLLEAVLELFMPVLMAHLIDFGLARGDRAVIFSTGLWMLLTTSVGLASACVCQYSAAVAAQGVGVSLRAALFDRVLSMSGAQFDRFGSQTLYSRLTNDAAQLQSAVNMTIRLVIRAPFVCIGSVVAALLLNWRLGLIVLVALPLLAGALYGMIRVTSPLYARLQKKLDALGSRLRELLTGVRVVRAFAGEPYETKKFRAANDALAGLSVKVGRLAALTNPLTTLILNVAILCILWLGGRQISVGGLTTGELLAFLSYVTQILTTLVIASSLVVLYTRSAASLARVNEVLAVGDDPAERRTDRDLPTDGAIALEVRDLTFRYPNAARPSLQDVGFTLPKGGSLGVIGATGAGKSTLVSLLLRFYRPEAGEIRLFGRPLDAYDAHQLRRLIGLVPQRVDLLTGSVADNIRMGNPALTHDDLVRAARIAQADGFISALRGGYDARLTEGGGRLSGGQRQRIAIARTLAPRPPILILDDASSALDYATDAAFRRALAEEMGDTTLLVVSQRVWAVASCDTVLVLDDGAPVALGRHEELCRSCEIYRQIVASQEGESAE